MIRLRAATALCLATLVLPAAAAERYAVDPAHSHIQFGWNHFGFSNPQADFDRFDVVLMLDTEDWSKSSVEVTIPLDSIDSGVAKLDDHLESADFFDVAEHPTATFKSTAVEQVGAQALRVAGDLSLHGITRPVVLDVTINKIGAHPMSKKPSVGFDARAQVKRSDFGVDKYAPGVSDEVWIRITAETSKAE